MLVYTVRLDDHTTVTFQTLDQAVYYLWYRNKSGTIQQHELDV